MVNFKQSLSVLNLSPSTSFPVGSESSLSVKFPFFHVQSTLTPSVTFLTTLQIKMSYPPSIQDFGREFFLSVSLSHYELLDLYDGESLRVWWFYRKVTTLFSTKETN